MTLAILIFALIVATCFIAYIADNIGKNLGKKRISIFGLRPRQTATLISMATSVVIMLLTVAILMLTSASLRNALLRYDTEKKAANKVQREYIQLQAEKEELLKSVRVQREQIELNRKRTAQFMNQRVVAERLLSGANKRLDIARKGEASARARAQEAQTRLNAARKQFDTFKSRLAQANSQVQEAKKRVQNAQSLVENTEKQLKAEQGRVESTQARLGAAQQKLVEAQSELQQAQSKQETARQQFEIARRQLEATRKNLEIVQKAVEKNVEDLTNAQTEKASLEVRRDKLQAELETKERDLENLQERVKQYQEIQKIAERIATGDVGVQVGEVFAEETVPPHASTKEALTALRKLVSEAREELGKTRRGLTLMVPQTTVNQTEEEFLSGFAAHISTLEVPVSIRLIAARDHARGESSIIARLLPIQVRKVFEQDEVLASAAIDAGSEDFRIFNRLLALLNENEQRARERGVMPLLTEESPFFYHPRTNEQVFDALRRIQAMGGIVRVRLLAAENISTVDSPKVKFEITRQ
jgi:uncharacterized protein (DUF3084 family)